MWLHQSFRSHVRPSAPARSLSSESTIAWEAIAAETRNYVAPFGGPAAPYWAERFVNDGDVVVIPEFIQPAVEQAVVSEVDALFKRRRYESGHWDGVIRGYRESLIDWEYPTPNSETILATASEARAFLQAAAANADATAEQHTLELVPHVHVLDLDGETGRIDRHVDSVKFSGSYIVGVCLCSPAVMLLTREIDESPVKGEDAAIVALHLPRRCVYLVG